MAIVNNGTKVSVSAGNIPDGAAVPTPTEFDDESWSDRRELTITKSTIEDASAATSFDNIVAEITTQVTAIVTNDNVASNTVTIWTDFLGYSQPAIKDNLTTAAETFTATVFIRTKVA